MRCRSVIVRGVECRMLLGCRQQLEQLMMRVAGVRVLVVMPHEPKAWHSEHGQEEPHETQAPEPSHIRVYYPPSHCTASLAAVPHA